MCLFLYIDFRFHCGVDEHSAPSKIQIKQKHKLAIHLFDAQYRPFYLLSTRILFDFALFAVVFVFYFFRCRCLLNKYT